MALTDRVLESTRTFEEHVANPLVCRLLCSQFHWLASSALTLVAYTGHRSGTRYTIPVAYARVEAAGDAAIVVLTPKTETVWWTNFREPTACTLRLRGRRRPATGEVVDDDPPRTDLLESYVEQRRLLAWLLGLRKRPWGDDARRDLDPDEHLAVVRFSLEEG
ncbi:hypothetical protein [Halobiforma nitratireducens]|uniref:DUF385 domain-containing protein n=1 Tax=Halobiforma nitratireducens JCM 10879 TaxID=1227454 RepID=M0MP31_9EURY|nr:hypothetical protein [Halobiforma nitratireducens]EMA46484.1 hypothetical protein C446_01403 [Halobiforma nitratireducens JCM 10879]